ncbi:MAG: glycosyltransferase [Burkholderiales bacterium]|nr:glycosyltransferase [Burkholderiales bacterium]
MKLTYVFCTYNRAERLPALVAAMRAQQCTVPFEILAVDNNSSDSTQAMLQRLASEPGVPMRIVLEKTQGIVPARNRAIEESLGSDILVFVDDDELPHPGLLDAACHAILNEGADCVGGRISVDFSPHVRPTWLDNDIVGFLGELDYGPSALWVRDGSTPLWSGNIAYRTSVFRDDVSLRFDQRYNREGADVGGGEDAAMFHTFLARGAKIRYRPDMVVSHYVEGWRLTRRYFLKLHYRAGLRQGQYQSADFPNKIFGVPPFLATQFLHQCGKVLAKQIKGEAGVLRQAMNAANALGTIVGYRRRPPACGCPP